MTIYEPPVPMHPQCSLRSDEPAIFEPSVQFGGHADDRAFLLRAGPWEKGAEAARGLLARWVGQVRGERDGQPTQRLSLIHISEPTRPY